MSEPENLTLILLRELRAHMDARFNELAQELKDSEERMGKRIDELRVNGMKGLATFVGHRALTERAFGSVDTQLADHEARLGALEAAP